MTEQKFCSGCQTYRNTENMTKQIRGRGNVRRWICNQCLARMTTSKYQSKRRQDPLTSS